MIFSPSQTSLYMSCPMRWHLERQERWRPRVLTKQDAARIVGTAFAAGIAHHNMGRRHSLGSPEDAAYVATKTAANEIQHLLDHGCTIKTSDTAEFDYAPTIAARTVERICADDPIPSHYEIVDVERAFPDHGDARPDLVCRDGDELVIVDYKTAMSLRDTFWGDRVDSYKRSWQMYHYAWAARTVYGLIENDTVQIPARVRRYEIVLIRIEPWKRELIPFRIDDTMLKRWQDSAWQVWEQMSTPHIWGPRMSWESCVTKYGPCPMQKACWNHHLDEQLMALDYLKVERREETA